MKLKIEGWLVTEGEGKYYLYPILPHRRTDSNFHETGGWGRDCTGDPDGYTTYTTYWTEKNKVILTIEKNEIKKIFTKDSQYLILPELTEEEMQRGIMEIEFDSEGVISVDWKELKNDEIEDLDGNIVRKKVIEIFQRHCYSNEDGWVKPRDFSVIGRDVSEDIFDDFTNYGWLKKEYNKTKVINEV